MSRAVNPSLVLVAALLACVHAPPKKFSKLPVDKEQRASIRRIAVVASRGVPVARDLARADRTTLAGGAFGGFLLGLQLALELCSGATSDPYGLELAACTALAPLIIVPSTFVGMMASDAYPGNDAVREVQAHGRAGTLTLQDELRVSLADALARATAYEVVTATYPGPLQPLDSEANVALAQDFDAALEVRIRRLDPYWVGSNLGFELEIAVELADSAGMPLAIRRYVERTQRRRVKGWSAESLQKAIRRAADRAAGTAVDELFLLAHMPGDPEKAGRGYMLEPERALGQARSSRRFYVHEQGTPVPEFEPLPVTRWRRLKAPPAFEWERFEGRWAAEPLVPEPLESVVYDFRIYSARFEGDRRRPDVLQYEARGLTEPLHRPGIDLAECAKYFWTVRARFRAAGMTRVTEWAGPLRYEAEAGARRKRDPSLRWGYGFVPVPRPGLACPNLQH